MRAILKLILTAGVIAVFGFADSIELYAIGGAAVLALPFVIARIDRRARIEHGARPTSTASATMTVMPLPRPVVIDDDIEGMTVRAPMSHEEAYAMHARYSPNFDQQAAIARYEAMQDEAVPEHVVPEQDPPSFDQRRYAQALQYAEAFEAQLSEKRRTAAYSVAQPRRIARGSYTPQQYRTADTRSDQRASSHAGEWDDPKTLIGMKPVK